MAVNLEKELFEAQEMAYKRLSELRDAEDKIESLSTEVTALRSTSDYYKEQLDEIQRILGFLSAKNYIGRVEESTASSSQEPNNG